VSSPSDIRSPDGFDAEGRFSHLLREIPAWVISLAMHLAVLLVLASIAHETLAQREKTITSLLDIDETAEEQQAYKFDATVLDQVGSEGNLTQLSPSLAAAKIAGPTPQEPVEEQFEERLPDVELPPTIEAPLPNEAALVEYVDLTGMTEHPGGVDGAIDRITYEIAGSLKERRTLVVWLFDVSQSLKARREAIADRFENVYRQLGLLKVGSEGALKTAIASYGSRTQFLTDDPVDSFQAAVEKVRSIESDPESSQENIFGAVADVTEKWKRYRTKRRRNMMIVVVTDERGDDYDRMDDVISLVKRHGIRVHCIGNSAIFGREHGFVRWVYEDGYTEDRPVDRGPESAALERLQLAFWGGERGLDRMSAGFGPFALTRLCAETGGMFLVAEEPTGPTFDPAVMKSYAPDYIPLDEYKRQLVENLTKGALVQAAVAAKAEDIPRPRTYFIATNDNVLREQINEAQKPFADLDYHLKKLHTALRSGEAARKQLAEPRWRAGYDLARGRALAMRARAHGYNAILAEMKRSPKVFQKEGNNAWRLVASSDIIAGPQIKTLAQEAKEYLTRVIDEHPNTPWAMLAERELGVPLGWEWRETYNRMADLRARAQNDPQVRVMLAEEEQKARQRREKVVGRKPPNL